MLILSYSNHSIITEVDVNVLAAGTELTWRNFSHTSHSRHSRERERERQLVCSSSHYGLTDCDSQTWSSAPSGSDTNLNNNIIVCKLIILYNNFFWRSTFSIYEWNDYDSNSLQGLKRWWKGPKCNFFAATTKIMSYSIINICDIYGIFNKEEVKNIDQNKVSYIIFFFFCLFVSKFITKKCIIFNIS
jgi:hypothetical protein